MNAIRKALKNLYRLTKNFVSFWVEFVKKQLSREWVLTAGITVVGLYRIFNQKPYTPEMEQIANLCLAIGPAGVFAAAKAYQKGRTGNKS